MLLLLQETGTTIAAAAGGDTLVQRKQSVSFPGVKKSLPCGTDVGKVKVYLIVFNLLILS